MKTGLFFIFCFSLLAEPALAEYRVFLLKITKAQTDPKVPAEFTLIESTLDPDQYRGYYTVNAGEKVTYIDTWRCFGRTNGQPLCPNPRHPASTEGPDSTKATP